MDRAPQQIHIQGDVTLETLVMQGMQLHGMAEKMVHELRREGDDLLAVRVQSFSEIIKSAMGLVGCTLISKVVIMKGKIVDESEGNHG